MTGLEVLRGADGCACGEIHIRLRRNVGGLQGCNELATFARIRRPF